MYDNKYIKTKIKICNSRINTIFLGNKIPEETNANKEYYTCLSVILLDSVVKIASDYYLPIFLEECKFSLKKKKDESDNDKSNKSDEN